MSQLNGHISQIIGPVIDVTSIRLVRTQKRYCLKYTKR